MLLPPISCCVILTRTTGNFAVSARPEHQAWVVFFQKWCFCQCTPELLAGNKDPPTPSSKSSGTWRPRTARTLLPACVSPMLGNGALLRVTRLISSTKLSRNMSRSTSGCSTLQKPDWPLFELRGRENDWYVTMLLGRKPALLFFAAKFENSGQWTKDNVSEHFQHHIVTIVDREFGSYLFLRLL